ncbi:heavy metal translocating P-type ATPase [Sinimarinibacterium sp. CAU 1509]|uniref:heavy metal translocating P-type ATPase n=1 Tax=Sinimarinibacterium sp. CAU 1509 TaxID=2562283 RepID=UPI0010AC006D|nr:heavy metal translocating P-type ATPase [Sinimarinibacterium sp. CAU 1509]TJY61143.1 heavy metal translocating P-type ATPase [Sinimarinibacterium sp. CAU 1509]
MTKSPAKDACGSCNAIELEPTPMAVDRSRQQFRIPTMDCASEESEIRHAVNGIAGIGSMSFQLGARTMTIEAPPAAVEQAVAAIRKAGFDPLPIPAAAPGVTGASSRMGAPPGLVTPLRKMVLALVLAVAAEAIAYFLSEGTATTVAEMVLALGAIWLSGFDTYKKGLASLRRGRLNITALMTVAVTGAFLIGQWPEAAMVMALYSIAELIEARSLDRARNAIQSLMALTPDKAEMRQPDGSWMMLPATEIPLEAIVRIRPGARLPLDGVVTAGNSAIDQSPVTGESIPVDKTIGDPVFAGTINQSAELEFRVTAAVSNTTLARIIHAVEAAQGTRAPTQRFVDRFAAIYTPGVFVLALVVALLSPWLAGWTWTASFYKALVLLVIACPCALVISTPVTVVSALAAAARRGILIKGGTYIEEARKICAIALDKTGTITEGKPKLVETEILDGSDGEALLTVADSLSSRSNHPVSKAIADGLNREAEEVTGFTAIVGRGVSGQMSGERYVMGNHRLIEELGLCSPALEAKLKVQEEAGRTVTVLASSRAVLALFAVADTIKETSRTAIAELKALGVTPVMLTGDNQATARTVAEQAGIADARGNLLPEDKLQAIVEMRSQYGPTAMTGDGINDAPALAKADIGIAMGGMGTDTAMEAADIVIMNDDLRNIAVAIRLSRKTHAVLWQNISLALGIKAVFLVMAVFGNASMWMAVFADMGASLLVVGNGLRLLRAPSDDCKT